MSKLKEDLLFFENLRLYGYLEYYRKVMDKKNMSEVFSQLEKSNNKGMVTK